MLFNEKSYDDISNNIKEDRCSSFWLKNAIEAIEKRDILDMMNDIAMLEKIHKLYREKFNLSY